MPQLPRLMLGVAAMAATTSVHASDLPDPSPDPYGAIGTAALLTPTHAIAGAGPKRSLGADRLPISWGAVLAWPRLLSGEPSQTPTILVPSDGLRDERFGAALAWHDGLLAVGSPGYIISANLRATGRVRLFDETFNTIATIDPPVAMRGLEFGSSLALDAGRLIVGAPGWRPAASGNFFGAAFVYAHSRAAWTLEREIDVPNGDGTRFGTAVALAPLHIAIGAPSGGATLALDHGRVWLYDRDDVTRAPIEVTAPDAQLDDRFGVVLASAGDILVVGAPGCACEEGRVFIGRLTSAGWTQLAALAPPDSDGWPGFGSSVAIVGPRVVVGTGGISRDDAALGHRLAIYQRINDRWNLESVVSAPQGEPALGVVAIDAAGTLASEPLGGQSGGGMMRYDALTRSPDLNGDGQVGAADLAILLGAWGLANGVEPADLDGDGVVSAADLANLLGGWTQ